MPCGLAWRTGAACASVGLGVSAPAVAASVTAAATTSRRDVTGSSAPAGEEGTDLSVMIDSPFVSLEARSAPAQILAAERKRANPLAGDLEHRLRDRGRDLRDRFLPHARDPFVVGLEEFDVDLRRIVGHAGHPVLVEVLLRHTALVDGDLLPQRVAQGP